MNNTRILYDAFNMYYENGMDALKNKKYEIAKRNIYNAANSLLKLAKLSQGPLKGQRLKRAFELEDLANKISEKQSCLIANCNEKNMIISENIETIVKENDKIGLDEALSKLKNLIGLKSVKEQIMNWVNQINVFKKREEQGLPIPPMSYHLILTGNPGTGKTTVARIISQIYCALGITKTSNFVETDRTNLVAGYVGQTAIKTKAVLNKAHGGVLFIDEAYTLSNKGDHDFGQEAIDTLLKDMEDNRENLVVITAGYDNLMKSFINSNPGLKSRFKTIIKFDDYTSNELYEIFMKFCKEEGYMLEDTASQLLKKLIQNMYNCRKSEFGNAREMRNLFEEIVTTQSRRVCNIQKPSKEELMKIIVEDIPFQKRDFEKEIDNINLVSDLSSKIKERNIIIRENNKEKTAEEEILDGNSAIESDYKFEWDVLPSITFNDVAGLEDVKEEVKIKVLLPLENPSAFEGYQKKNGGGLLLYGPPGTGKTMIAAAIANEIGAKFCSVKPSDLLHQGAGNTEKAVKSLFKQARQHKCAIIYFDEMDSIAQKDTKSTYAKQLRSELLAQLQGVESYNKESGNILYLIAATNKPWEVDSAFIRPGRFGTRIYVGLPDENARRYMIENRLRKINEKGLVNIEENIDIDSIVKATNCFNGSDITNLLDKVEELSILRAIKDGEKNITSKDFINALSYIKSSVQKVDIEKLSEWNKINSNN